MIQANNLRTDYELKMSPTVNMLVVLPVRSSDDIIKELKSEGITVLSLATDNVMVLPDDTIHSKTIHGLDLAAKKLPTSTTFDHALQHPRVASITTPDYGSLHIDGNLVKVERGMMTSINLSDLRAEAIATKFLIFPNLPQECQDKIWVHAIMENCEPRVITAQEFEDPIEYNRFGFEITGRGSEYVAQGQSFPMWLHLAGPRITQLAVTENVYTSLRIFAQPNAPYYRPELDVLRLVTTRNGTTHSTLLRLCEVVEKATPKPMQGLKPNDANAAIIDTQLQEMKLDVKFLNPKLFASIRHLEVDGEYFLTRMGVNGMWLLENIVSMPHLKTLQIRGEIVLFPGQRAPEFFKLSFEHHVTPGGSQFVPYSHFIPVYHGVGAPLLGPAAWNHLNSEISDPAEIDRYQIIWEVLEWLAWAYKNLPTKVEVITSYLVLDFGGDDFSD